MKPIKKFAIFFSVLAIFGAGFFLKPEKAKAWVGFGSSTDTVVVGVQGFTLFVSSNHPSQTAELYFQWNDTNRGTGWSQIYDAGGLCGTNNYGSCSVTWNPGDIGSENIGMSYIYYVELGGEASDSVSISFVDQAPTPITVSFGGNYTCVDTWGMYITGPPNQDMYLEYWGNSLAVPSWVNVSVYIGRTDEGGWLYVSGDLNCDDVNIGSFTGYVRTEDRSGQSNDFSFSNGRFGLSDYPDGIDENNPLQITKGESGTAIFHLTTDGGPEFYHSINFRCDITPAIIGASCSFWPYSGVSAGGENGMFTLYTSGTTVAQLYDVTITGSMRGTAGITYSASVSSFPVNIIERRIVVAAANGIDSGDCSADLANCDSIVIQLRKTRVNPPPLGTVSLIFGEATCGLNQACDFSDFVQNGETYAPICPASGTNYFINGTRYTAGGADPAIPIGASTPTISYLYCNFEGPLKPFERLSYSRSLDAAVEEILMDRLEINTWPGTGVTWYHDGELAGSHQGNVDLGDSILEPSNWNFVFENGPLYYLSSLTHNSFRVTPGSPREGNVYETSSSDSPIGRGTYTPWTITFNDGGIVTVWERHGIFPSPGHDSWYQSSPIRVQAYYKPSGTITVDLNKAPGSSNNEYTISVGGDGNSYSQPYSGDAATFDGLTLGGIPGWTEYTVTCERTGWPSKSDTKYLRDVNEDHAPYTPAKEKSFTCDFSGQISYYTLSVSKTGTGSGTITSNPSGINCGGVCSAPFAANTSVTLTASPDLGSGSIFSSWSGCDSVSGNSCTVNITSGKLVIGSFDSAPPGSTESSPSFSNSVYVNPCNPNLGLSQMWIWEVNSQPCTDKACTNQTIVPGDTLTFRIVINNSGNAPAYDLYIQDTLSSALSYVPGQARLNQGGGFASVSESISGQTITINPGRNLGDKSTGSPNWLLELKATIAAPSATQPVDFFQNSADIYYSNTDNGPQNRTATVSTGSVSFRASSVKVPIIHEIGP